MSHDKITGKIIKLIRLGSDESASPEESRAAFDKAAQLMAEHNITRDDIDHATRQPKENFRHGLFEAYSLSRGLTRWEVRLSIAICELFGSVSQYTSRPNYLREIDGSLKLDEFCNPIVKSRVHFYGSHDDSESARETYITIRANIQEAALTKWNSWARGDGAAYAEGFVTGLFDKIRAANKRLNSGDEATRDHMLAIQDTQLAIIDSSKNWLKEIHGIELRTTKITSGSSGGTNARNDGYRDGQSYNPNKVAPTKKLNG